MRGSPPGGPEGTLYRIRAPCARRLVSFRLPAAFDPMPREASTPLARAHAFMAAQNVFTSFIDVDCSLVTRSGSWIVVYNSGASSVADVQNALGHRAQRTRYNLRNVKRVFSTKRSIETELNGFSDLWVPLLSGRRCDNLLASGPFLHQPLTAEEIRTNWTSLTGEKPRPSDPRFIGYVRTVLRTQVLDDDARDRFMSFLQALAELLAGKGDSALQAQRFWFQSRRDFSHLPSVRLRKGALLVDPVTSWTWAEGLRAWDAEELGLSQLPNQVLAVLPAQPSLLAEETLDHLVRAERFQTECVALARRLPNTIAARLADTGVLLLTHVSPKLDRTRRRLLLRSRSDEIQAFVRRQFSTSAFIGAGELSEGAQFLHRSAEQAVFAMQLAVHRELPLCFYADEAERKGPRGAGPELAARLASRMLSHYGRSEPASLNLARMDYVRAVVRESGGGASVMRVHFEHSLFALLERVQRRAQLEPKPLAELEGRLAAALESPLTTVELITVFRHWWDTLLRVESQPSAEDRKLRMERARLFIQSNCHEPLSLAAVARHTGFSRNYFSRIFKEAFGKGFEHYLTEQRLARAKRLLRTSALPIGRVSSEAGFKTASHFSAAFRRSTGQTPQDFRAPAKAPAGRRPPKK